MGALISFISLTETVTALIVATLVYLLSIIIANQKAYLEFKKKSSLPIVPGRNLLTGHGNKFLVNWNNWKELDQNHKKYGKTYVFFKGDKPFVSTIDLDLVEKIVLDEANDHINRPKIDPPLQEWSVDSMLYAEGNQWRRIRRAFAPAFTSHKIKSPNVQADIDTVISRFIEAIETKLAKAKQVEENKGKGIELNADDIFQRYSVDLLFTSFYKQNNLIDHHAKTDKWRTLLETGAKETTNPFFRLSFNFPIFYYAIDWIMRFDIHPMGEARTKIMNFIKEQTRQYFLVREENKNDENFSEAQHVTLKDGTKFRRNLTDMIIERLYDGTLTEREYLHSSFLLFNGASKSTSDFLASLFYYLAKHQSVQEKLRESIRADGVESEYLDWVMHEALRMQPPAIGGCQRVVSRDIMTDEGLIPKGTYICNPATTIHRLQEYWGKDADEFKPERWANSKNFHPVQFLAFGAGKRNCPGSKFVMIQSKKLLNVLLQKFSFKPSPKPVDLRDFSAPLLIFLIAKTPIHIVISPISEEKNDNEKIR